ncbi:MAG: hypothetical protein ACXVY8_06220 [Gaiellaceae bacterium]
MTCDFGLDHYREILAAARKGGYRFRRFEQDPSDGDIFLRHDVDLSLAAALRLAELEAELDVQATYFLMTRSVFYNLLSPEGAAALARLRELGHAVGLHALRPHVDADSRFDRVLAWHNPDPETMTDPLPALENVMSERFFRPDRYRSDSNRHWRSGCPHEALARREFEWLQLLTHPEIWVFPGETMGETMRAMLEAERERDLERLEADRIDMA